MIASSAFVLAALTMTGVYMKNKNEVKDDGYSIDFTSLENNVDNKADEIIGKIESQQNLYDNEIPSPSLALSDIPNPVQNQQGKEVTENNVLENDLDYMPLEEAGSNLVEIPNLTEKEKVVEEPKDKLEDNKQEDNKPSDSVKEEKKEEKENTTDQQEKEPEKAPTSANNVTVAKELHFNQILNRPSSGDILLHYSMDSSIYFPTLEQYKYNPAVVIGASQGDIVNACAEGKVLSIFENEEIGKAVLLDLGDGYQATYGQLDEIAVAEGSYINAGEKIGIVAAPTIYYSVEGTNVYFELTQNGNAVNPEGMFQ